MSVPLNISEQHKANSAAAQKRKNQLPRSGKAWHARRVAVRLFQAENGEWRLVLGKHGQPMLATDAEVSLWLELQEARNKNSGGAKCAQG